MKFYNPIFSATSSLSFDLDNESIESLKEESARAGYSNWRQLDNEGYAYDNFYIEARKGDDVFMAQRPHPDAGHGNKYMLFYEKKKGRFSAVKFLN